MPQYDLVCCKCGAEESVVCHHTDKDSFTCNVCEAKMLVKPAACAFTINGSKSHKGDRKNYE